MDNIIKFPGTEDVDLEELAEALGISEDTPVETVLLNAAEREFDDIIIIGTYNNKGNTYFATTSGDPAKIIWDLERSKHLLMKSFVDFQDNPYDEE